MDADRIRFLFDYSYAATARILAAAAALEPGAFAGPAPVRGCASLRDTLVHVLDAERAWRHGLRTGRDDAPDLDPDAFPTAAALADAWRTDEALMRAWLATLDDAAMSAITPNGRPLWHCLAHVVNHGTQHRSEAAMMLTHWGCSPGELDLSAYSDGWNVE